MMTREESIILYKTHAGRLYNISLRIVGDSALAEEIMQDTVLKYLQSGQDMTAGPSSPRVSAWLSKTCIRASIDALRKMKRERTFLEEYSVEEAPDYFAPVDDGSNSDKMVLDMDTVKKAIDELPDPYRIVLNLVLVDGLDYEEISELTGEKEGTIRTRYSRAKKMLLQYFRNI